MDLNIIVPAHNEAHNIGLCIRTLALLYYDTVITISADGSDDDTESLARTLAYFYRNVTAYTFVERQGKGKAIKNALLTGTANAYYDCDMSIHPYNIKPMYDLLKANGGLVIAKRVHVNRNFKRLVLSKCYALLVKVLFNIKVSDFQAGLKLLSKEATQIASTVKSDGFFFDTELIVKCKQAGLPITEYTVAYKYSKCSSVSLKKDSLKMLTALAKLKLKT